MKKNRVLYSIALLMALAFVYFYSGKIVYIALYAVVLMPLFSLGITFFYKSRIRITQKIDSGFIIKGQEVQYHVKIQNLSPLSFTGVKVVFADKKFGVVSDISNDEINLNGHSAYNHDFKVLFQYRGKYEIGVHYLELRDFLGLFRFRTAVKDKMQVMVYPRVVEIQSFPLSQNLLARSQSNLDIMEEDYTTVSDIRKYQPTDSYKKIHWKLTAKKNELIVKNYQATAANGIALLLDLHTQARRDAIEVEDKTIETIISLAEYCLKRRIQVDFVYGTAEMIVQSAGATDFDSIYALAADLQFTGGIHIEQLLFDYLKQQEDFTNLIICTSSVNSMLYDAILHAQGFGHNVVLLYFKDNAYHPDVLRFLQNLGSMEIQQFMIGLDDNIEHIF